MKRALFALLIILVSCQRKTATMAARSESMALSPPPAPVAAAQPTRSPQQPAIASPSRMIIRNATMSLVVRDAVDALRKITALVDAKGGYVAETKQWKENEQVRASATVRVPATQLSSALATIRGFAVRIESENITAQDVSQEYTDLGAQLRNLQAAETELRELLRTVRERTQKASEIMEIYNEITKVRGEIDRIQARLQYLSQMTELSTITVELVPDALAAPVVEPGWQPVATVKAASRALINSMKSVVDALIWIVLYLLPLGLVFVALVLLVRAIWLRIRRQGSAAR
jgi:hypothetical protein